MAITKYHTGERARGGIDFDGRLQVAQRMHP